MIARRNSLRGLGVALAAMGLSRAAGASPAAPLVPKGAKTLDALTTQLAALPRRRDFKRAPMILDDRSQWEAFVDGNNLTNQTARPATSLFKDVALLPGRNVSVGLRAYF